MLRLQVQRLGATPSFRRGAALAAAMGAGAAMASCEAEGFMAKAGGDSGRETAGRWTWTRAPHVAAGMQEGHAILVLASSRAHGLRAKDSLNRIELRGVERVGDPNNRRLAAEPVLAVRVLPRGLRFEGPARFSNDGDALVAARRPADKVVWHVRHGQVWRDDGTVTGIQRSNSAL
jgi:hypothetical protein